MRFRCVGPMQLKMVFTTRPKTHPILFIDLRGYFPTGKAHFLAYVLETFSEVSSWNTGRILGRSSYHRYLGLTESPLKAIQSVKHDGAEDLHGEPGYFAHQGSPSPQYWNANLKRTAYPSPLSAVCFSAIDAVSTMFSLAAGEY
jgi:hypothetical protein